MCVYIATDCTKFTTYSVYVILPVNSCSHNSFSLQHVKEIKTAALIYRLINLFHFFTLITNDKPTFQDKHKT